MTDFGNVPPIEIEELTGEKRKVRLVGRGLPYRPLAFNSSQRVEVTWLPGSPEGTATILGATEKPTQLNGMWKEKYVSAQNFIQNGTAPAVTLNGTALQGLEDIVDVFDAILREGQLLEFRWGPEIRRGFMTQFEKRYQTVHDVMWMVEFAWISRGEETGPVVFGTISTLDSIAGSIAAIQAALNNLAVPSEFGLDSDLLSSLQDFQRSLEEGIFSVTSTITEFTGKLASVVQAARGIVATFQGLEDDALALIGHVEEQFGSSLGINTGPQSCATYGIELVECAGITTQAVPEPPESHKLIQRVFLVNLKAAAQQLLYYAASKGAEVMANLGGNVVQQVQAQAGQDLRDIAAKAYGSPYEWRTLLAFNDFPSIEIPPGTIVFIPQLVFETTGTQGCV